MPPQPTRFEEELRLLRSAMKGDPHKIIVYIRAAGQSEGTDRLPVRLDVRDQTFLFGTLNGERRNGRMYSMRLSEIDHIAIYPQDSEWRAASGSSCICFKPETFKEIFMSLTQQYPTPPAAPVPASAPAFDADAHVRRAQESLEAALKLQAQEKERREREVAAAEAEKARAALLLELDYDAECLRVLQLLVQDLRQSAGVYPVRPEYAKFWEYEPLHDYANWYGFELTRVGNGAFATLTKKEI